MESDDEVPDAMSETMRVHICPGHIRAAGATAAKNNVKVSISPVTNTGDCPFCIEEAWESRRSPA